MTETKDKSLVWYRVQDRDSLPEGRVTTVQAGNKSIALTHYKGKYGALDNHCPHQGGPLGEGSIENGFLRCPWHGWDYCPHTGQPPGGFDDAVTTYAIEERDDGIYVGVEEEPERVRTLSDVMAETLVNWDIKHVFGMVGHSNLGMADALRLQEEKGNLSFFDIRHEGAASFACSAYAKLTGKPAACFAIAGPGATNLLTGLYDAKVDRAPVLALTGQVDTQVLGPGAFQEVNLAGAFNDVSCFNHTVLHSSKHAELVSLAVKNAVLQRSVANLILPNEVQEIPATEDDNPATPAGRVTALEIAPPEEPLSEAINTISDAKRPVIIVGHGARFHMDSVIELAEQISAPVLTTFKGKGLISDTHPLGCGVLGRSGTPIASWFMNESDLLIVIGASFSNHTGITPKKPIIQIDFEAMALGKFHAIDIPLWGEIGVTVKRILSEIGSRPANEAIIAEVAERWAIWRAEKQKRLGDNRGKGLNSASVFASMTSVIQDDAVIAVDVGNNTYSFGRYFECSGKQAVLMSGYLGSIGFGYPAAIGAWAAVGKDRAVWCVSGDGGFAQYMGELLTAVKYSMNITHVLLHNDQLGKIAKEQRAGEFPLWKIDQHNPNFADYATNCGAKGIRVTSADELDSAMKEGRDYNGPALIEIMTDAALV